MGIHDPHEPLTTTSLPRYDLNTDEDLKVLPAGRLQRLIGKPPEEWSVDDLIELVRDRHIRLISLMHIGGDGWLKTLDFAPQDFSHLRDILTAGERADGSSLFKGMGIPTAASDVVLRPRVESAFLDPFSPVPTLVVMCAHLGRDGKPLPESPDTIVYNAYERVKRETGIDLHALGEVEYFLGKKPNEEDMYGAMDRGYHAPSPFVFGEALRRRALALIAEIGFPIKYGHSEVGYIESSEEDPYIWEQHEVELALQPLPRAAYAVALTQWILRNLAHQSGMKCSFDPIVRAGHAGSGMHFHISPMVNGIHKGSITDSQLLDEGKWLIGGLTQLGGALMAFGNRDRGSFVRLTQGKEAPNTVTWGQFNRKALIRLPIVPMDPHGNPVTAPTIEFRLPDGSTHPHLLLAGIGQCVIHGKNAEDLEDRIEETRAETAATSESGGAPVPKTFAEVQVELEKRRDALEAGKVFPAHMIDSILTNLAEEAK
jgi:glutamine synthetase